MGSASWRLPGYPAGPFIPPCVGLSVRSPDFLTLGKAVGRRRRRSAPTQVLQSHCGRKVHPRRYPQALSSARPPAAHGRGGARMSSRPWPLLPSALRLLLATTSLLLPRSGRSEWIGEWRAELYHIVGRGLSPRVCIAFALGAFPDALWIRRHSLRTRHWLESPRRCLAVLAVSAGLSVALALLLPHVRQDIFPPKYDGPEDLAMISPVPSVSGSRK